MNLENRIKPKRGECQNIVANEMTSGMTCRRKGPWPPKHFETFLYSPTYPNSSWESLILQKRKRKKKGKKKRRRRKERRWDVWQNLIYPFFKKKMKYDYCGCYLCLTKLYTKSIYSTIRLLLWLYLYIELYILLLRTYQNSIWELNCRI